MIRNTVIISFLLLICLSACEDVVDVNLDQGPELLVVDGQLTDLPAPDTLTLSTTAPYFTNAAPPIVTKAAVTLTDNLGNRDTLKETKPGKYLMAQRGQIGRSYTLRIRLANGEQYTAQTEIKRAGITDRLIAIYEKPIDDDEGYYAYGFLREPKGQGDFYRFKSYVNTALKNLPQDLSFSEDRLVEQPDDLPFNPIDSVRIDYTLKTGDKVRFEVLSITEDQYNFFTEMIQQTTNGGLFANPPANVRTNVRNTNPNGRKAVGYFGGSAVSFKEIVVE